MLSASSGQPELIFLEEGGRILLWTTLTLVSLASEEERVDRLSRMILKKLKFFKKIEPLSIHP